MECMLILFVDGEDGHTTACGRFQMTYRVCPALEIMSR